MEAALATAHLLRENFSMSSELWFSARADDDHQFDLRGSESVFLDDGVDVEELLRSRSLDRDHTVIVTHGCWQLPTLIGARCKKAGYRWVYVPHGMLEPWSLRQKALKKAVYWHLREYRMASRADLVRATSFPEQANLQRKFSRVSLVSNGVASFPDPPEDADLMTVLFMGRLHPKKGASNLAKAWLKSDMHNKEKFRLLIVGDDDGDGRELKSVLNRESSNIELLDPIFGTEKDTLFRSAQFFVLPSHSEGMPMALLEGMSAGLVPVISEGCNMPKALETGIGIPITPQIDGIIHGLNQLARMEQREFRARRLRTRKLIEDEFSVEAIAQQQNDLYQSLFS